MNYQQNVRHRFVLISIQFYYVVNNIYTDDILHWAPGFYNSHSKVNMAMFTYDIYFYVAFLLI